MTQHGFPANGGPIFVMLQEHELGRTHVQALASMGAGEGELSEEETGQVKAHAEGFFALLSAHIQKEDVLRRLHGLAETLIAAFAPDTHLPGRTT
jgi:hemerythrin-like domain-containing protein